MGNDSSLWPVFIVATAFIGFMIGSMLLIIKRRAEEWLAILNIDNKNVFFYAVWEIVNPEKSKKGGNPIFNMYLREIFSFKRKSKHVEDLCRSPSLPEIDQEVCLKRLHYYYIPNVKKRFKGMPVIWTLGISIALVWLYIETIGHDSLLPYIIPVFVIVGAISGCLIYRLQKRELDLVEEINNKAVLLLKED